MSSERLVEQVASDIYRIHVPLPGNPLREVNSYLLKSDPKSLLIDLGFDLPECHDALEEGLVQLGLSFSNVDVLMTHGHPDHCGCIRRIYQPSMQVYAGFPCTAQLQERLGLEFQGFLDWFDEEGEDRHFFDEQRHLSEDDVDAMLDRVIAYGMGDLIIPRIDAPITVLNDGDVLEVGDMRLEVALLSGHCPRHICLYEPERKILIAGDQVLPTITPSLAEFMYGERVLDQYLASFDTLERFDVDLVLPAHREPYSDLYGRLGELRSHHANRADEVMGALKRGCKTVKDVARSVTWRNPIPNWDDWPVNQKFFSIGESLAHLSYLEEHGQATMTIQGGRVFFHPAD